MKRRRSPWKTRVQITVGITKALSLLERTQNLDDYNIIRPHQISLDKDLKEKISDVEVAKLANVAQQEGPDPLYYHPAILNYHKPRCNIGTFGELLVQILTGECNSEIGIKNIQEHMKNQRGKRLKESLSRALDPRLPNIDKTTIKEAIKIAGVALSCLDDPSYTLNSALDRLKQL